MRPCPACGAGNREDDEFCGNCGSYLGWSSRPPQPPPAAAEPAVPAEPAAGPTGRAPDAPGAGAAPRAAEPPAGPPPAPRPEPPAASARSRGPEPAGPPPVAPPAAAPEPPPQPVRPAPARPEPPAEEDPPVVAVQPAEPIARRPVVRPVAAEETPDGPPCPACGTPNLPERRFCRRCAAPLQTREQPKPLPWWRTVWPLRRRARGGPGRMLRRILLVLVVVGLLFTGFLLLPVGRYLFEDVRDKRGGTAPIGPSRTTASAQAPGHPASAAVDGVTNTYWGAPALDSSLTCAFDKPFRLVGVTVHTGVSKDPREFRRGARPTRADLFITTADGEVRRKAMPLADKPGPQTLRTGISDVVSVRLVLRDASGQGGGRPVALGEVEFHKRT
ncbi:NADase-type glycan-binding domain-containing protein [Streptomyces sp. NPDC014685]|uniref:NADase-type glycan-binding domain-containing protein n=1 Tax=Streptomyces sp. NPDC014685 TaxID=3364881 RepID=UPI00370350F4